MWEITILWWLIGSYFLWKSWTAEFTEASIADVITIIISGLMGPVAIIIWLESKFKFSKSNFFDTIIWRKKNETEK